MEENLTAVEDEPKEAGQMDDWTANLMGGLVSSIAMSLEDMKQVPNWLEVSFLIGGRTVKIEVTFQESRNSVLDEFIQQHSKDYGTTNT